MVQSLDHACLTEVIKWKSGSNIRCLTVRPYHLLCLVCALGAGETMTDPRLRALRETVAEQPDRPVALRCYSADSFAYQDPGTADDSPESKEFNQRRDFEVLLRLNLAPGSMLPARQLLARVWQTISTVDGICAFEPVSSPAWRGCTHAHSGYFAQGLAQGLQALIPPRDTREMQAEKVRSLAALAQAEAIPIRPHILLCAVAQYGNGVRPPFVDG